MTTDSAIWRSIRQDFESLTQADWSLIWSSRRPVGFDSPEQLPSQWTWFHPTEPCLRTRASAIFLKAARALGYSTEDRWLDELRDAKWVRFQLSGSGVQSLLDGTKEAVVSGVLKDAVQHSITLCHQLEAGGLPKERGTTDQDGEEIGGPDPGPKVNLATDRGAERCSIITPILSNKGYSRSKWAAVAGVDPSVVYGYLTGDSNPRPESRKCLAEALGLSVDELPK